MSYFSTSIEEHPQPENAALGVEPTDADSGRLSAVSEIQDGHSCGASVEREESGCAVPGDRNAAAVDSRAIGEEPKLEAPRGGDVDFKDELDRRALDARKRETASDRLWRP
jgi:hypothetical protein